jgi:ketol-acid reductoisomerase
MAQAREGAPFLLENRAAEREQPIEQVGRELRQMMPFLTPQDAP